MLSSVKFIAINVLKEALKGSLMEWLHFQAVFRIADVGVKGRSSISVKTVLGDGTATLHVQKNQSFFIEFQEFTRRRSFPPVNFKVDYTGEVILVSDFHVSGKKNPAFQLDGRISGVSNLSLAEGRVMLVGENASSALLRNKRYLETPIQGKLTFGVITMEASSKILFAEHMKLDSSTMYMRQKALISAETVAMVTNEAHLEGSSSITSSGKGPRAEQGVGLGSSFRNVGSGAGHGGQGGPGSTTSGGLGYGSYVYPVHPGSGGGGFNGGAGGSTVEVAVIRFFLYLHPISVRRIINTSCSYDTIPHQMLRVTLPLACLYGPSAMERKRTRYWYFIFVNPCCRHLPSF